MADHPYLSFARRAIYANLRKDNPIDIPASNNNKFGFLLQ